VWGHVKLMQGYPRSLVTHVILFLDTKVPPSIETSFKKGNNTLTVESSGEHDRHRSTGTFGTREPRRLFPASFPNSLHHEHPFKYVMLRRGKKLKCCRIQ
jgi:hypothetical protein